MHTQANHRSAHIRVACLQLGPQRRPQLLQSWNARDEQPETNSLQASSNKSNTNKRFHTQHTDQTTSNQNQQQRHCSKPSTITHKRFAHTAPSLISRRGVADVVSPIRPWPCDSGCVGRRIGCSRRWREFLRKNVVCSTCCWTIYVRAGAQQTLAASLAADDQHSTTFKSPAVNNQSARAPAPPHNPKHQQLQQCHWVRTQSKTTAAHTFE